MGTGMTRHRCQRCGGEFRRGVDNYGIRFRLCTKCAVAEDAAAAAAVYEETQRHSVPNIEALRDQRERCPLCIEASRRIKRSKFTLDHWAPLTRIDYFQFADDPGAVIASFMCGAHGLWCVVYSVDRSA